MLLAGATTRVITPSLPFTLAGHREPRLAKSVADELEARVICLHDGETSLALISLDLIWLGPEHVLAIRRAVASILNTSTSHVVVACTHTHSGPDVLNWYKKGIAPESGWFEGVTHELANATQDAINTLVPVKILSGIEKINVAVNRRLPVDGKVLRLPNKHGPVDNSVRLISFEGTHGHVAQLLIASLHPVLLPTFSTEVSGDWCGASARYLDDALGGVTLVLNSAPGDNNPILWTDRTYEEMLDVGRQICSVGLEALQQATFLTTDRIAIKRKSICVPVKAHAYLTRAQSRRIKQNVGMLTEVQVMQIGSVQFCALPGECLVETAIALAPLIPISYANDYIGYLPLSHIYAEGGYEPSATMTDENGVKKILATAYELSKLLE